MAVTLALLTAANASADTISTFDVSGTVFNISGERLGSCINDFFCSFGGTLTVDVTNGTPTAADITFPGLPAFDSLNGSGGGEACCWVLDAENSSMDSVSLLFLTFPTPGSLVGFEGGTIRPATTQVISGSSNLLYFIVSGSILSPVSTVPEPSSRMLLAVAVLGFVGFGLVRKRAPGV